MRHHESLHHQNDSHELDARRRHRGRGAGMRWAGPGVLGLAVIALSGCAYLPADPSKMSAEQLKAAARDKNSSVACSNGKTAAGNVTLVYVNVDQAVPLGSSVTVEADCKTTVQASSIPRAASAALPK